MITNKKSFSIAVVLIILFFATLVLLFLPIINGQTAIKFADNMFNSFAKGSTYFIPEMQKASSEFAGKKITVKLDMKENETADKVAKLIASAGAEIEKKGTELMISSDLGAIFENSLQDADAAFNGRGDEINNKYGYGAREVMYNWWLCFKEMKRVLNQEGSFQEASMTNEIMKKAIEPAYNFYGVESKNVKDYSSTLIGLLTFYIVYTLWWGFAIFFLFEGLGITMTKAEKKAEI